MTTASKAHDRAVGGEPLLAETADRLFAQRCDPETVRQAEVVGWNADLWQHVGSAGLPWVGLSGDGSGGSLMDVAEVLHRCGRFAVPLPIAETGVIGGWLLQTAGRPLPEGPVTVPVPHPDDHVELSRRDGQWRLQARLHRVPWAHSAELLVFPAAGDEGGEHVVVVNGLDGVVAARNLAGEPRDTMTLDVTVPNSSVIDVPVGTMARTTRRGALSRALLIGGALERSSELATAYARERQQFGQVIARFQAVQHHLVLAAEYAASATLAAWTAAAAMMDDEDDPQHKVAIARIVAHDAVGIVTGRSHQVFGAIGMTKEHDLHLRTRRAWAWTEEWGSGRRWSETFGTALVAGGAEQLWPTLASGLVSA